MFGSRNESTSQNGVLVFRDILRIKPTTLPLFHDFESLYNEQKGGWVNRTQPQVYIHFTWGTWDRLGLINSEIEKGIHKYIHKKSREVGCSVVALGGTSDHVHLLIRMRPSVSISEYIKSIKGGSSHFINQILKPGYEFKWQGGFRAFTISPWYVSKIIEYINNQTQLHIDGSFDPEQELPSTA